MFSESSLVMMLDQQYFVDAFVVLMLCLTLAVSVVSTHWSDYHSVRHLSIKF